MYYNESMIVPSVKEGAIELRSLRDGDIQMRLVLGKLAIGKMKRSSDCRTLAMELHPRANNAGAGAPTKTFDVGVYQPIPKHLATIPRCSQLLDVVPGDRGVAVVRGKKIELLDVAANLIKSAPFEHKQVDAARFSPDGKLLAIADRNQLVLWRYEENTHERIDLGRRVASLAFSPDGRFLAEGPASGENVQVRDIQTRKVVQSLSGGTKRSMNVPGMAYTQGGRVLIAFDSSTNAKPAARHRITLWDTATGSIAHQIALPAGRPSSIDVTPNGRYLAALLDDGGTGRKLCVWRLDGEKPETETGAPPAAARPR
jgi:hypothetical protein